MDKFCNLLKKVCPEQDNNEPGTEVRNDFNNELSTKSIIEAKSISPILQHQKLVVDEEPISDYDINITDEKSLSSLTSNNRS